MTFDQSIGIKQIIRYEWMQYTVKLLLEGMSTNEIKKELEIYLSDKKGGGIIGERAKPTMNIAMTVLLHTWVTPITNLIPFRDKLLKYVRNESSEKICQWSMFASAYPFWFNISYVFGSLFKLQDKIKKTQVMSRIYELFGERNTVERCSRYVIRSLVAWDIIKDSTQLGFYEKGDKIIINDNEIVSLLIEAVLNAIPEKTIALSSVINNPSLFIFSLPNINFKTINNDNIIIENMSINNEYLKLR